MCPGAIGACPVARRRQPAPPVASLLAARANLATAAPPARCRLPRPRATSPRPPPPATTPRSLSSLWPALTSPRHTTSYVVAERGCGCSRRSRLPCLAACGSSASLDSLPSCLCAAAQLRNVHGAARRGLSLHRRCRYVGRPGLHASLPLPSPCPLPCAQPWLPQMRTSRSKCATSSWRRTCSSVRCAALDPRPLNHPLVSCNVPHPHAAPPHLHSWKRRSASSST